MKTYDFAPIAAREYPTLHLLDNPYIWGGVGCALNVSEKPYPSEIAETLKGRGIEWKHCPVSEEEGAVWTDSLLDALGWLYRAYLQRAPKTIVHCDWGNNRSRAFVEAFAFMLTGEHIRDEYKGEFNHLAYNCKIGHLPPLEQLQGIIHNLKGE